MFLADKCEGHTGLRFSGKPSLVLPRSSMHILFVDVSFLGNYIIRRWHFHSACTDSIHKNLWIILVFQEAMPCEVLSCGSLKIKDPIVALYEWVATTCYTTETFYNITLYPFGQSSGHASNFYSSPRCQIFTWLRDNSLILWSCSLSFQQHLTSMTSRVYFRPRQQKKHHRVLLYFFCLLTVYMVKSGG